MPSANDVDEVRGGYNAIPSEEDEAYRMQSTRHRLFYSLPVGEKRSADQAKPLPAHEHVCPTVIRTDFQPKFGHGRSLHSHSLDSMISNLPQYYYRAERIPGGDSAGR